jgi:HPt (histidine-containing phosphotransfer) domain-containing protein
MTPVPGEAPTPDLDDRHLLDLAAIIGEDRTDEILAVFTVDGETRFKAAQEAFRSGNLVAAGRCFHALKSSAHSVGAIRLANAAARLEADSAAGDADAAAAGLERLDAILRDALSAIARRRSGQPPHADG